MTSSELNEAALGQLLADVGHFSFDKDGTLTDVHEYWASVIAARAESIDNHYRRWFRVDLGVEPLMRTMGVDPESRRIIPPGPIGYGSRDDVIEAVVRFVGEEHGLAAEKVAESVATIFSDVDASTRSNIHRWVRLLPGTASALRCLKDRGVLLSIVTGDRTAIAVESVRTLGIEGLFDVIIGGDDMTRQKPHPDGLLTACERIGIAPRQSAYVGDAPNDLRAARAAQMRSIGVLSGLGEVAELEALAEHVCLDVPHLVERLTGTERDKGIT